MPETIERFDVDLPQGIRLRCRAAGQAGLPKVVLLHGFPEAAFVWDEVMGSLCTRARCIAPNLRGYAGSSAPAEVKDYRPKHLVADIAGLIEALGAPIDLLVAHDWGGALAWGLAAQRPELLKRMLIINAPHAATFLRELRHNPAQQAASLYMNQLCEPGAEALFAANDFERLWATLARTADGAQQPAWASEVLRARYREVWQQGLRGPLNYYRASPLRPPGAGQDTLAGVVLADEAVTVRVPTTVLWGERDAALLPALLDGLDRWVPRLEVQRVPNASHWIVHEQPALVAAQIARLLALPAQTTT